MRRKSAVERAIKETRIERARKMTPEERLLACANISTAVLEIARAGKRDREERLQRSRR